jgi:RNA polymerase sigma-70 factor (ECF subfamily)
VISLRFLEELSIRETAEIMNKTEGAVKALQYRATNSLQRILEETDDEA